MADVTILATALAALQPNNGLQGPFWTSPSVGYVVLIDSGGAIEVWKTSDSGASWAEVDSTDHKAIGADLRTISAWFDQQTPGDTGTAIHIAWLQETDTLAYAAFETSTDQWGSTVNIDTGISVHSSAPSNTDCSITKSRGGTLFVAARGQVAADADVFYRSADGTTWNSRAVVYDAGSVTDRLKLVPGNEADADDIWAIYHDVSVTALSLKVYDDSGDSWSETAISGGIAAVPAALLTSGYFAAAVRHSDGHALVAAFNDQSATADCQTWDINGAASITAKTDLVTNADNCYLVDLLINQQNDDIYAVYTGTEAGTETILDSTKIYYKKSTDGMANWGSETAYSVEQDDERYVSAGGSVGDAGGRFMPVWYNRDLDDVSVNDGNDIEIAAAAAGPITINLAAIVVHVVLPQVAASVPLSITLEAIVVDVVLPAPTISGLATVINLEAIVVDAVFPASAMDVPRTITLEAIVVDVVLPAPAVDLPFAIDLEAIIVDAVLTALQAVQFIENMEGFTGAIIGRPGGVAVTGLAGAIVHVVHWETQRELNRVGRWSATISAAEPDIGGTPLADSITRGWELSLVQENTHPLNRLDLEYLLYRGVIEDKKYSIGEEGQALCELSGSFRGIHLAARITPTAVTYTAQTVSAVASSIEGGLAGGITVPSGVGAQTITLEFNREGGDGILGRYARLLRLGEYARMALRETWEEDALEFVSIDAAPDSGYYLVNQEAGDAAQSRAAEAGFALIGGTPEVRREGRGIVNRIVGFGVDTTAAGTEPLPLSYATRTTPYAVKYAQNADLSFYHYLEDAASIAAHGLVEMPLHRTDIKNPSDNATTRKAAANVLHAVIAGELLKNKSPKVFVTIPVANGPHVWALPGDKIRNQYVGWVETDDGAVTWQEFDQDFLVVERRDTATPSGARAVSFVLAAPEMEIPIPALPGEVVLPITSTGGDLADIDDMMTDLFPGCCDDPATTTEEADPGLGPPDLEVLPISPMLVYLHDGSTARMAGIEGGDPANEWAIMDPSPGGLVSVSGPLFALSEQEAAFRMAVTGGAGYAAGENRGDLAYTANRGDTWSTATPPGVIGSVDYQEFHCAIGRGGIYAWWTSDNGGATPADAAQLFYSEDAGATWTRYRPGLTFLSIMPHQVIEANPALYTPGTFAMLGHGHSPGQTLPEEVYLSVVAPGYGLAQWDTEGLLLKTSLVDYNALLEWVGMTPPAARFVIAALNDSNESVIVTYEVADIFNLTFGTETEVYNGGARGRPIGLVRNEDGTTCFAAFADGTVLRSAAGVTWEVMTLGEEFGTATSLVYDQENDYLWIGGAAPAALSNRAMLQVWVDALTTAEASVEATRNLAELGGAPGHLGMIVWPGPQPRLVNLQAIVVDTVVPALSIT